MKVVFFGNPLFASKCLDFLIGFKDISIDLVVTNPDKRMGRGLKLKSTAVKEVAAKNSINIFESDDFNSDKLITTLKEIKADLFIVIAYRILPKKIFSLPKFGCFNLHASLLPQYRGSSPIQYSLLNGDRKTGLTTFFIDDKVDKGNIIFQEEISINSKMNYIDLSNIMIDKSYNVLINTITMIKHSTPAVLLNKNLVSSFAPKIQKENFLIDWNKSSSKIHNQIRALIYKGAYTLLNTKRVKFFETSYVKETHDHKPGSFFLKNDCLYIGCKSGYLLARKILIEGSRKVQASEFHSSYRKKINIFGK